MGGKGGKGGKGAGTYWTGKAESVRARLLCCVIKWGGRRGAGAYWRL